MTANRDQILLAAGAMGILCLLVVPMPAPLLDLLISLSISISLLVLLLALFAERPLEFSVFPTLLIEIDSDMRRSPRSSPMSSG